MSHVSDESCLPGEFTGLTGLGTCGVSVPEALTVNHSLNEILCFARRKDASDVHISVGNPVILRRFGKLEPFTQDVLTFQRVQEIFKKDVLPERMNEFLQRGDLEYVHTIEGAGRFRLSLMKQRCGWDMAVRVIPMTIAPYEQSGLPAASKKLTQWAQGLVLVTGPAGCGKTTTLSVLVEMMNQTRDDHIITIENPIEVVFQPKNCQITQREIGTHTLSQHNALRAALREDPDIIIVSELRDLDSIRLAITAAETGHLVLGTMNTRNAVQTISSLINSFPSDEQPIVTAMLSESLRGVISQQLIPSADGQRVVPCYELLVVNHSVANLMRERKFDQITNTIATGKADGMVLLDNALKALVQDGTIAKEEAIRRAFNPKLFEVLG